ncbi:MAG TPA: mycofactocin-associated electron transfer flavoprotein beta subunit, partial [Acidimicrobiales bacterium]|nr:mycofactocin-associated electron transfer flavoprotein beta subunit [Acidimicrobiales bacterium]
MSAEDVANGEGAGLPGAPSAAPRMPPPGGVLVVACMKLVELRAGVDPLTGAVIADPASAGPSPADEAALEWALRIGEAARAEVVALCAGGAEADPMLRGAVAAGASRAVRVPVAGAAPSAVVAAALAAATRSLSAAPGPGSEPPSGEVRIVVCCGDASIDRGSGSVPAFLAAELAAAQALGLVSVSVSAEPPPLPPAEPPATAPEALEAGTVIELLVERRLDRGRRERLRLRPPCVLSVEAVTARLRRASLGAALAARTAKIEVLDGAIGAAAAAGASGSLDAGSAGVELMAEEPFRPRTRLVPPPAGAGPRERILELTGSLHERPAARTLVL